MDDLKVVLYIVVAIIWVVYNNYKKISEASKKRDLTKPFGEIIQENWPKVSSPSRKSVVTKKLPSTNKGILIDQTGKLQRPVLKVRDPLKREKLASRSKLEKSFLKTKEGGSTQPSKIVHFEDDENESYVLNPVVAEIRNADLRKAIVLSEILKRPYY